MEVAPKSGISGKDVDVDTVSAQECRETVNALPSVLDLTQAQSLRGAMVAALGDRSILLDASAVERMSTPCVQVMLAAGRAADLANAPFQIARASEAFRAALDDLGLQAEFEKWMV